MSSSLIRPVFKDDKKAAAMLRQCKRYVNYFIDPDTQTVVPGSAHISRRNADIAISATVVDMLKASGITPKKPVYRVVIKPKQALKR